MVRLYSYYAIIGVNKNDRRNIFLSQLFIMDHRYLQIYLIPDLP